MTTDIQATPVTQADRFSLTLFLALVFHAILILGISFDLVDPEMASLNTMEITLVESQSDEAPEDADYLAQSNQLGGGNTQEKERPSTPFSNPMPVPEQGIAPESRQDNTPPPMEKEQQQREVISVTESELKAASKTHQEEVPLTTKKADAAQLFERSQEIARLSAEISKLKQAYQQTPKHTYVHGANAKAYRFASYLDAWRAKVERIGNLNYPETAIRNNLSGNLLLDVAINPDGSLHSTRVLRSSGHTELDQAAIRIVQLSSPFPPLTKDILKDTDILHIPRVWRFRNDSRFSTSVK